MADWNFAAVGDVLINRENPRDAFFGSKDLLERFDLVFGNCEGAFTDCPHFAPSAGLRVYSAKANGMGLAEAGFNVMGLANNHILDAGYEGLADTLELLHSQGIKTVGVGANLAEARTPTIVERDGVKVGFLAFASVYPTGYEARASVPGLAAMRVHSFVASLNHQDPGVPPEVRTIPYPEDVELLKSLIMDLRTKVDVVVVSHHWGQFRPVYLTEYERVLAHASVEAGADIVLGHHHHFLRGVEIYMGKPIYYGLGHFVFDTFGIEMTGYLRKEMGEYAIYPRDGYPLLPFHPDARMTLVASFDFDGKVMKSFGFFPCLINQQNHAIPFLAGDQQAQEVIDYVSKITDEVSLKTLYGPVSEKNGFAYCRLWES
ncbi:CapA family protein [Burkholderia sp. Leaf177]|uniref:CapA family protein n=1 Tax=Burkholderia sp. Leaf177 TaxID=1736287 RepID=UPI000B2FFCC4|nr:CapA family protein [Burkholderia sp. Leaf177]